jgi:hypothetical protein
MTTALLAFGTAALAFLAFLAVITRSIDEIH